MTRLVDVADFASGGTPSKTRSEYWNGTIPWLTPKDMADWEGKTTDYVTTQAIGNGTRIVPAGSVFIAVRGMSLHTEIRVIFSNDALAFNQDIKALLPKKETDGRFVYYALSAHKEALLALVESAGHGTGRLPTDQLEAIEIPDFSCEEQRQIVELLGALDDKIDLNRRTNETLEAMARALFRDWFVDFGPTRTKMAGQTPYLGPEIWKLFPDRLDDEGKPEGWIKQCLRDVLTLNYGKSLPSDRRVAGEIPVYGSGGASGFHNELLITGPAIIVGRKGTVGSLYWEDQNCFPIDTVFYVSSSTPLVYCFYLLQTLGLESMNTDAAVPGLNRDNAYRLEIPTPPGGLVDQFSIKSGQWRQKIRFNNEENSSLAQLRDLLLPKLMSGEIRIRDAEKMVADAL